MSALKPKLRINPLNPSTVYPCTLSDLETALSAFPQDDLTGLTMISLVPCTKKNQKTNAVYISQPSPRIEIYAYPFPIRLRVKISYGVFRQHMGTEIDFGMKYEVQGRWIECSWSDEGVRMFTLAHVLPHEVGHHVYGYHKGNVWTGRYDRTSEDFAEGYARQLRADIVQVMSR